MHRSIRHWATASSWGLAFVLLLGSRYLRHLSVRPGPLHDPAAFVVEGFVESRDIQWLTGICIGIYLLALTCCHWLMRRRITVADGAGAQWPWPEMLLVAAIGWAAALYGSNYGASYQRTDFLTLLAGATAGQAVAVLRLKRAMTGRGRSFYQEILPPLIFVAALMAVFHPDMSADYRYRGHARWNGPFTNPNSFGLVMGMGVVLALGCLESKVQSLKSKARGVFLLGAAAVTGLGLVKSYSRGAWIGCLCGLGYLAYARWRFRAAGEEGEPGQAVSAGMADSRWQMAKGAEVAESRGQTAKGAEMAGGRWRIAKGWRQYVAGAVILVCGVLVLAFLNLRHVEQRLVRRAFSVGNVNDFSWRNRAVTSVGALQVMGDRPLAGAGWDRYRRTYDAWHRPASLRESAAIELDDYLILGMTLGLPALVCLLGYVGWRFASGHRAYIGKAGGHSAEDWDMAVCRGAFLVLLVGFVPETGIFHLALGAPFWILLELGAEEREVRRPKVEGRSPMSKVQRPKPGAVALRVSRVRRARTWVAAGVVSAIVGTLAWAYLGGGSREREPDDPSYRRILAQFRAGQPMGVSVSPGGKYVLTKAEEGKWFRVSVVELEGGRMVASDWSEDTQRALTWRPDSQAIAFQESAGMDRPLCLLDVKSGRKTRVNAPVSQTALPPLRWEPAGKRLVYFQGDWNKGRLVVVSLESGVLSLKSKAQSPKSEEPGAAVVVKEAVSGECDFVWAPDGSAIAVADEAERGAITLVRLADMKASRLGVGAGGVVRELAWSPDGGSILATARGEADEFFRLFEVEIKSGTASLRAEAGGDISNPVWLPDGRSFLYQVLSNGVTRTVMGNRDKPCVRVVGPTNGVVRVSHVAANGSRAYARYAGLTGSPELIEISLGAGERGAWSAVYGPGGAVGETRDGKWQMANSRGKAVKLEGPGGGNTGARAAGGECPVPEFIGMKAFDGTIIPGYHWRVPGRNGPAKAVLIVVHGGLHTQTFPTWEPSIRVMLDHGCDVIAVNYRGSSGYGRRFEQMGEEAERVLDVLAAREYAIKELRVRPNKVYLSGLSHGASLSAAAAAQGEEIGGLILISWAGPIRSIEGEFVRPFPILAFHGELDATVAAVRARAALEEFVAPAGDLLPKPRWRQFEGEGHFFYRTASWAEVYWELARMVEGEK